jgi:hypothetical protein
MAGSISLGTIAKLEEDPFPSTGEHSDIRVKKGGKYIDPMTAKSIVLQNIAVGKDKIPLVEQKNGKFKTNFPITSPYGQRIAPTAGASTFHRGTDFGIPAGTPLFYKGYGEFKPGKGMGTLETTVAGVPYTLEFLHIKPGQQAEVLGQQQQQVTQTAQPTQTTASAPQDINLFITLPKKQSKTKEQDFLGGYISQVLSTPTRSTGLKINPIDWLTKAASAPTNYSNNPIYFS